jgi:hypothetical protein
MKTLLVGTPSDFPPPLLTPSQTSTFITQVRGFPVTVKIVAIEECMKFAQELVNVLRAADCKFEVDLTNHQEIFLAKRKHEEVIIRYQDKENSPRSEKHAFADALMSAMNFTPRVVEFPKEITVEYIQIEIGGAP